jgi:pyridoxal phosphate enzyme (YggS family)
MQIEENVARVRERIERAAKKSGRAADAIALMAVSKTIAPERIREAYQAGLRLFGENRVQEFAEKSEFVADLHGAQWHLIGHLQSNKAAKAADLFQAVDSVDSVHLAEKLNAAAEKLKKKLPVLIEVNVGGEAAKSGVAPISNEMESILRAAPQLIGLEIRGLMTVPPFGPSPEHARPYFRMLRELRDEIARRKLKDISMDELSMGMSHDFEVAIEEGSTCVRIGTAIFGARAKPQESVPST